jgi:hypothetical protein
MPQNIATAQGLGAKTVWTQSGFSANGLKDPKGCWIAEPELKAARSLAQSAGLNYVSEPYIGEVAREIQASR